MGLTRTVFFINSTLWRWMELKFVCCAYKSENLVRMWPKCTTYLDVDDTVKKN